MSVTKAQQGDKAVLSNGVGGKQEFTVAPPCDIKDHGRWVCLTHDKFCHNNFDKDSHIERGKHVLAWFCAHHGVEQP